MSSNSNFLSKKHQCISLLRLCSSPKHASQIHAQIHISGLHQDTFLLTELIRLCSLSPKSKNLVFAQSLLHHSTTSVPYSWNFVIRGYASSDTPRSGIWVFREMRREGVRPNNLTFPFVIKACASCYARREGKQVHADVVKFGFDGDVYVNNNLVHFYGLCKKISYARKVFDRMPIRSLVSWNSVITACVDCFSFLDALKYFVKMMECGFVADETTLVLILSVCNRMGNLSLGRWVHCQVIKREMVVNSKLGTALVDMYAKGGAIGNAKLVFDRMKEKNVWTWSAMISGLAQHGFGKESLHLFSTMKESTSIPPNDVTFLGVLCACSHAGLVDDGFRYFYEMEHEHGIKPMMVHYGALVDTLARAGHLKEAYDYIVNLPVPPDPVLWRTLLSSCSIHSAHDKDGVGDMVRKRLLELEPRRGGNFLMVANMYADAGKWEKAEKVRKTMRTGGMKTRAGESCVELDGSVYGFFSGYHLEDDLQGVYQALHWLKLHMEMVNFL